MSTSEHQDILDRAADALLGLAAETPWREVTLRSIAERAGLTLAELYTRANSKAALLAHVSACFDLAALAAASSDGGEIHDRLFDATMARIEAMGPHREGLIAIARANGPLVMMPHFPPTARSILEAAGVEATAPRLIAMTAVWARTVQVWRDDEGAFNRTMAEIDKLLKDMRRRLAHVGAGF